MKKKYTKVLVILTVIVLVSSFVLAAKPNFVTKEVTPSQGHATVTIPEHAVEITPGVFSLGTTLKNGNVVEGFAFVHYKENFEKPTGRGENVRALPTSSCYKFLATGAKWKSVEPYLVNPVNTKGLNETFVRDDVAFDINKWEDAANGIVGDGISKNILGDEVQGIVDGIDLQSPDNKNEIYFADVDYPGAIAVTVIWGVFSGPIQARKLVEWDQVYDDVDFDWSATGEAGKMDFENIATHELGHSVGLNDLYDAKCSEQTMYGYADYGETKKRSLESGDIKGVKTLYR